MGLLHSLANPPAVRSSLPSNSPLSSLITSSTPLDPLARAKLLSESRQLEFAHAAASRGGQTETPGADDRVDLHFTCFVRNPSDGQLVELDGRRKGPIKRGITLSSQEELLPRACQWIQENYVSPSALSEKLHCCLITSLTMHSKPQTRWQWIQMRFSSTSSPLHRLRRTEDQQAQIRENGTHVSKSVQIPILRFRDCQADLSCQWLSRKSQMGGRRRGARQAARGGRHLLMYKGHKGLNALV